MTGFGESQSMLSLLDHPSPTSVAGVSNPSYHLSSAVDDSRHSHLPCLLVEFLASLRDPLNGWLVLWEKRVISDLLSWKWERHKGQAKWILSKVVHAVWLRGGGMTNYTMSPSPNRQSPPWHSCVLCLGPLPVPRRWGRQCSRSPLQHPFTGTRKGAKAHGIYGRLETQLLFPTSPWQHAQSHWHPVLKGWEWARMPKNKTTIGLKVPCSWQFFVTMGSTMTRKMWQKNRPPSRTRCPHSHP